MIDNKLRETMMEFEQKKLLPKARKLLKDSGIDELIELELFPIEGYYYKTKKLSNYFNIIRNLQEYEPIFDRIENTKELKELQIITGNKLFGSIKSERYDNSPLPRMKDIMTLCMEDKKLFPEYKHHPWNIKKIMNNLLAFYTGNPNIVELATLINKPECLVAGCETDILYREDVMISGCASPFLLPEIVWNVDKEVQNMGINIINRLNELTNNNIPTPTEYNNGYYDNLAETPRIARLGYQKNTEEHYYWILERNRDVRDLYTKDIITTESYKNEM